MTMREIVGLLCAVFVVVWAVGDALDKDAQVAALRDRPLAIIQVDNKTSALTRAEREWVEGLMDARDKVIIDGGRMPAEYADREAVLGRLNEIGQKVGIKPCP